MQIRAMFTKGRSRKVSHLHKKVDYFFCHPCEVRCKKKEVKHLPNVPVLLQITSHRVGDAKVVVGKTAEEFLIPAKEKTNIKKKGLFNKGKRITVDMLKATVKEPAVRTI